VAQGEHAEFDDDLAQLLHGPDAAARSAVADEPDGLAVPLAVEVVEGVLEDGGVAVVVLGGDEHVAVGLGDLGGPGLGAGVGRGCVGGGDRGVEEGQGPVGEVDQLHADVVRAPAWCMNQLATLSPWRPCRVEPRMTWMCGISLSWGEGWIGTPDRPTIRGVGRGGRLRAGRGRASAR
jgi:hypothetical protein